MSRVDQGMAVAKYNYVGQDDIWRSHILNEMKAAKHWPENWQFMTTDYDDLVVNEFPKLKEKREKSKQLRLPPIHHNVLPSPRPIPKTTSNMIGWRSSLPSLKLERYGKYAKGKGGLIRQLNWPAEAI